MIEPSFLWYHISCQLILVCNKVLYVPLSIIFHTPPTEQDNFVIIASLLDFNVISHYNAQMQVYKVMHKNDQCKV